MSTPFLKRIASLIVSILLVHAIAFLMVRTTRGGPFDEDRALSPQVKAALEQRYGLDNSLPTQYWHALSGLLQGDFGPSLRYRDTQVSELLADALPISLILGGGALLLALLFGIPLGLLAGNQRNPLSSTLATACSTIFLAVPNFVLAGLLIALLSFKLGWLPPAGFGDFRQMILPWLCLALPLGAQIALLVRARTLETLNSPSVRSAIAQGLAPTLLWHRYVLRPSLTPVLAFLGPATAALLTGSLVIEQVFALPGLGTFFVQAALARDYTLALGVTVVYTALLGSCTLCADLLMARLDPRVEALS